MIRINCIYNDQGAWCINKNIKRSIFGIIGARCCLIYDGKECIHQKMHKRPKFPPPAPKSKKYWFMRG